MGYKRRSSKCYKLFADQVMFELISLGVLPTSCKKTSDGGKDIITKTTGTSTQQVTSSTQRLHGTSTKDAEQASPSNCSGSKTELSRSNDTKQIDHCSDENSTAGTTLLHRLACHFITRLETAARQYKSAFLFLVEASRYEVLITIIRECLAVDFSAKLEHEIVRQMVDKYSTAIKDQAQMGSTLASGLVQGSVNKVATLKTVLENIRAHDITGQMLNCIGVSHLWSQFRGNKHYGRVTSTDIFIFHHFIIAHFGDFLESFMLNRKDPETGIVALLEAQHYTTEALDQAIDLVDKAIVKIVFSWPTSCTHQEQQQLAQPSDPQNSIQCATIIPLACETCSSKESTSDASSYQSQMLAQQESLGRAYLNDYMLRWYATQRDKSEKQLDASPTPKDCYKPNVRTSKSAFSQSNRPFSLKNLAPAQKQPSSPPKSSTENGVCQTAGQSKTSNLSTEQKRAILEQKKDMLEKLRRLIKCDGRRLQTRLLKNIKIDSLEAAIMEQAMPLVDVLLSNDNKNRYQKKKELDNVVKLLLQKPTSFPPKQQPPTAPNSSSITDRGSGFDSYDSASEPPGISPIAKSVDITDVVGSDGHSAVKHGEKVGQPKTLFSKNGTKKKDKGH